MPSSNQQQFEQEMVFDIPRKWTHNSQYTWWTFLKKWDQLKYALFHNLYLKGRANQNNYNFPERHRNRECGNYKISSLGRLAGISGAANTEYIPNIPIDVTINVILNFG